MLVAAIKRMIPLSIKERLKAILVSPTPPPARGKKAPVRKLVANHRPCASEWPRSVCECDMHLGAFKQERIRARLLKVLGETGVEFVEDVDDSGAHIAVDIAFVPKLQEVLGGNGFKYEVRVCATSINDYDFPATKNGFPFASLVPAEHYEIRVHPLYFCSERRQDADVLSILISTFNDANGARLFHSGQAKTRVRALGVPREHVSATAVSMEQEPVDIVITTVDGSDPAWQEKFNAMLAARTGKPILAKTANAARFTSHDELRFVLRSLHYYAPYVRKIHIVTDAQCPEWLDVDHPKISLVDHRDIIDPQYLPTFNSDAIESCLWKIPGLSERFIYFNDDVFLMAPTSEATFYTQNGLPQFYASPRRIPAMPAEWADSYTMHAHLQTADALEKRGYGRPVYKYRHVPFVARKSILETMEEEFAEELARTRSSPLRSEASFATISFLYPNYALATRSGVLCEISYQYVDISWQDWRERLLRTCRRTDIAVACVNESHDTEDESLDAFLSDILSARFPCVAPWERNSLPSRAGGDQ